MPLSFKGTAHPRPGRSRNNIADLNPGEIGTTNLGVRGGTDLLVEHDAGQKVGRVLASWEGPQGQLRVEGIVDDPTAAASVRSGAMRGLSLGTSVLQREDGKRMMISQEELSLCVEPRRGGCYVEEINGKSVHTRYQASKHAGTHSPHCPSLPPALHPAKHITHFGRLLQ